MVDSVNGIILHALHDDKDELGLPAFATDLLLPQRTDTWLIITVLQLWSSDMVQHLCEPEYGGLTIFACDVIHGTAMADTIAKFCQLAKPYG